MASKQKSAQTGSKKREDRNLKSQDFTGSNFEIKKLETVILLLKSEELPIVLQVWK